MSKVIFTRTICNELGKALNSLLHDLSGNELKLMYVLCAHADKRSYCGKFICWPSWDYLTDCCGFSRDTLKRTMRSLRDKGVIDSAKWGLRGRNAIYAIFSRFSFSEKEELSELAYQYELVEFKDVKGGQSALLKGDILRA